MYYLLTLASSYSETGALDAEYIICYEREWDSYRFFWYFILQSTVVTTYKSYINNPKPCVAACSITSGAERR